MSDFILGLGLLNPKTAFLVYNGIEMSLSVF